ncbi:MAG: Asp-tRNA(Asn)/Glu-tRNA(Gln) amidotransferase subunit GatC [candidate division KSB1 bacterium]|nr:Asp-tRNA(Asn)/Glu-tRNA(Gln) amidotransferase subunit GatC [candidate division KSB1 bacterium]MDZ7319031.1 Asp-tRNA(Asn)/Glu-tRNA(Gln) amidotransferase subunit GatC [candidate division KSB1 bacterium]MDZ7341448.1 Asp-tRNA(Asn)/Glu-tRNA(Gln) amidotransferase subunit GatC [candidate division KSB1 bacterium]
MEFTIADIDHLASLAKLKFSDDEKQKLAQQLSEIRSYVDQINRLDLTGVPPTYHVLELTNVMREDNVEEGLTNREALMNAPASHQGFFSVPRVIRYSSGQKETEGSTNS